MHLVRGLLIGKIHVNILLNIMTLGCSFNFVTSGQKFILTVSVLSKSSQLVEAVQDIPFPAIIRDAYLWWGCSWHMQTPLENVDEGCSIRFELKSFNGLGDSRVGLSTLSAAIYPLDFGKIDSGMETMIFHACKDGSLCIEEHSFVQTDCMISKRSKSVTLEKYRRMVHISEPWRYWGSEYSVQGATNAESLAKVIDKVDGENLKRHLEEQNISSANYFEKDEMRNALKGRVQRRSVSMTDSERLKLAEALSVNQST
jgi:hypothetical protein